MKILEAQRDRILRSRLRKSHLQIFGQILGETEPRAGEGRDRLCVDGTVDRDQRIGQPHDFGELQELFTLGLCGAALVCLTPCDQVRPPMTRLFAQSARPKRALMPFEIAAISLPAVRRAR